MPTTNQLVRKGRKSKRGKDKAPALGYSFNSLKNRGSRGSGSPQKRGVMRPGADPDAQKAEFGPP